MALQKLPFIIYSFNNSSKNRFSCLACCQGVCLSRVCLLLVYLTSWLLLISQRKVLSVVNGKSTSACELVKCPTFALRVYDLRSRLAICLLSGLYLKCQDSINPFQSFLKERDSQQDDPLIMQHSIPQPTDILTQEIHVSFDLSTRNCFRGGAGEVGTTFQEVWMS